MGSKIRIFCTKLSGLSLRSLMARLQEKGHDVRMIEASLDLDQDSPMWNSTQFGCPDGSRPVLMEHFIAGLHGTEVEETVITFMEVVEECESSMGKQEAMVYLKMTRELYVFHLPPEIGKQTSAALEHCVEMLSKLGEGIVQRDGKGFLKDGTIVLELTKECLG